MNVNIALDFTSTNFPSGSAPEAYLDCRLKQGATTVATQMPAVPFPTSIIFTGISPGSYTFTAQVLDAHAAPIGDALSLAVTVPAPPPVVNQIPTGANVAFS